MKNEQITRDEEIRQIAYRLWQEAGCPNGYDVQHWLEAETIVLRKNRTQAKSKEPKPRKRSNTRRSVAAGQEL